MEEEKIETHKYTVCGLMVNQGFQMSKFLVNKLYKSVPGYYERPEIRPMLDLQWDEYILKMKRRLGNGLWSLTNNVIIFLDGIYVGDESDLLGYLTATYKINLTFNWHEMGISDLRNYLLDITSKYRQLVYLTIAIDRRIIGSMLFELYNDLVPNTCENFLRRCEATDQGYTNKRVHRIVKGSWIQCGGWCWDKGKQRCENYIIAHERRGILGMCNSGRHKDNTSQFFITLDPTPWMNYRFVAFGQLIQGNYILKQIEDVQVIKESPQVSIEIIRAGEFKIFPSKDQTDLFAPRDLRDYIEATKNNEDLRNIFSEISLYDETKARQGLYSLNTDLRKYKPFLHLPEFLLRYIKDDVQGEDDEDQKSQSSHTHCSEYEPLYHSSSSDLSLPTL